MGMAYKNLAGGRALPMNPEQALAQYAATGCLSQTFYASGEEQVETVLSLCGQLDPRFVAQSAIYARERAFLKDMPALLCAWLSRQSPALHEAVFARVIDNARMLRTYVRLMRSGVAGRRSLGLAPKRLVRDWLNARSEETLLRQSAGQSPSLGDVIRMVHPKPATAEREAFYASLTGRDVDEARLPAVARELARFRRGETVEVPNVPFQLLASAPLSKQDWIRLAMGASWHNTRMSLNTFRRHGVFTDADASRAVARKLRDESEIRKARVLPYQLMTAWMEADPDIPEVVKHSLHEAMETATENVPRLEGKVYVCSDVSG